MKIEGGCVDVADAEGRLSQIMEDEADEWRDFFFEVMQRVRLKKAWPNGRKHEDRLRELSLMKIGLRIRIGFGITCNVISTISTPYVSQ
ncbi:hypothetical protein RYX36_019142 [Vicia faba]